MNKKGHLWITDIAVLNSPGISDRHRIWLGLGSILPDLLLHTMAIGHTWDATFEDVVQKMKKLWKTGRMNSFSFLKLGYLLHYIEDYFTYPHNPHFRGSLTDHILYEHRCTRHLENLDMVSHLNTVAETESDQFYDIKKHSYFPNDIQDFILYIKELHLAYLEKSVALEDDEQIYEHDFSYMKQVVNLCLNVFLLEFARREEMLRITKHYELEHEVTYLFPTQKV